MIDVLVDTFISITYQGLFQTSLKTIFVYLSGERMKTNRFNLSWILQADIFRVYRNRPQG